MNKDDLAELPDEVAAEMVDHVDPPPELLDSISGAIVKKRDEAKAARAASGIEATWRESEEAYCGIDDANRHEFGDAKWSKPMSMDGPVSTNRRALNTEHKSTVFVPLTARYVDAGSAKLSDILLPIDDKAFSFTETPVPELIKAKEDNSQVVHDGLGNVPLTRPAKPGEVPPAGPVPTTAAGALPAGLSGAVPPPAPAGPVPDLRTGLPVPANSGGPLAPPPVPQVPLTVKDLAEEAIEMARKKAKAAETRIYDWMVECYYQAEARKVIFDGARIGVGVFKGPFPKSKRAIALSKSKDGVEVQIEDRIFPAASWVDPWRFYPDASCGENIHNGSHCFEEDWLAERQVKDLKDLPGYIASQIDRVLEEGPEKAEAETSSSVSEQDKAKRKGRFHTWYYYGSLKREEMSCICTAAGKPLDPKNVPADQKTVYAIVTMINDCVVRATINPLDSGTFPYNTFPWRRRAGNWAGTGVSEQIRTAQKILNAATRAMLNNAGKAAGSIVVVDQGAIQPADGNWTLVPDKVFYKKADSPDQSVGDAFAIHQIPNTTDQLMKIINYALQLAEESTSIPLVTQGQTGPTTPDTLGATQIQNDNANQLLRSIGSAFDDYITEPLVRAYYEYLLLDPDVPNDEKGDFNINAHGSAALVERAIADQTIAQLLTPSLNPQYGLDPKLAMKMFLKSKRLDPEDVQFTPEMQAKMDAAPQAAAPVVEAAKINQDTTLKVAVMKQQGEAQSVQSEERVAQAAQALEGQGQQVDATVRLHELQMRHDLAIMEYSARHSISINDAKVQLAKTAMQLSTEKELNAVNNHHDMVKHVTQPPKPAVQLPGRAKNGQAAAQS